MPKITYIEHDGTSRTVDAETGTTVMETAIRNGVPGIEAECGGSLACATCHCYVESHAELIASPASDELMMLAHVAAERKPNSRLACQVRLNNSLDGIVVRLPACQA